MTLNKYYACIFIYTLLSFSSIPLLNAQYNDLLDNPDITWLAEFTTDQSFSINADDKKEVVKLTKLYHSPSNTDFSNYSGWILDWVYRSAIDGKVKCYNDPGLTNLLSQEEVSDVISYIDTVTTFNPSTFEEQIVIVKGSINIDEIKSFRINQVIFYNKKTKNFETRVIAVAPILDTPNPKPLFWIEMNEALSKQFDIHSSNITWGVLAYSKANPLQINFLDVRKANSDFDLTKFIYDQAINQEKKVESSFGYGSGTFLTSTEISELYTSIDTVVTFSPDTYEETVQIIRNDLSPNEVSQFRLVQEWYYDERKKKLINRLKAIAPIVKITNEKGAFKYNRPLYYIRYD